MKSEELNITVKPEDSKLDDHSLFLKLYEEIENKYEVMPDRQVIDEEICRAINIAKNRTLCKICDGFGFLESKFCLDCRGKGHI